MKFLDPQGFEWTLIIRDDLKKALGECSLKKREIRILPDLSLKVSARVLFHEWCHCCFFKEPEEVVEMLERVYAVNPTAAIHMLAKLSWVHTQNDSNTVFREFITDRFTGGVSAGF